MSARTSLLDHLATRGDVCAERRDGARLLSVAVKEASGRRYVEVLTSTGEGSARVAVRPEELDALLLGLSEARRKTLGPDTPAARREAGRGVLKKLVGGGQ